MAGIFGHYLGSEEEDRRTAWTAYDGVLLAKAYAQNPRNPAVEILIDYIKQSSGRKRISRAFS